MRLPLPRLTALALAAGLALALAPSGEAAPVTPTSPTDQWTAISDPTFQPDTSDDQRTGIPEADIVGGGSTPALYMNFDNGGTALATDGTLAFRVRLGADKNPPGFDHFFAVGLDANQDGAIDLFLGVDNSGGSDQIGIFAAGSGTNTSPATTSIVSTPLLSYAETAANYGFQAVDNIIDPGVATTDYDMDGSTDFFLSFLVPFQAIVDQLALQGIPFDDTSAFQLVAGTSTQPSSLNQDLAGTDGNTRSTSSWASLGAISAPVTSIVAVPEPSTAPLLALGLLGLGATRWRRARRLDS